MNDSRRLIACAVGALMISVWVTTLGAGAATRSAGVGCHGLSPASAEDCTAEQLRDAFKFQP